VDTIMLPSKSFNLHYGIVGLIIGVGVGSMVQMTSYICLLKFSNWNEIAVNIAEEHAKSKQE
jgi:hypothetical protein